MHTYILCDVCDSHLRRLCSPFLPIDTSGEKKIRHVVSILGWGTSADGTKYWIGRNRSSHCTVFQSLTHRPCHFSWGTYWGENGFFKLKRGVNNLMIESECAWAVPHKNWKDDMFEESDEVVLDTDLA